MTEAQKALLARLQELVVETPRSGAVNKGNKPLHVNYFARAVAARADDGPALVAYVRAKLHAPPTASYGALIEAGRPDLTLEGVVADAEAPWAPEFTDDDRATARERLGTLLEAHHARRAADEATAVEHDRKIAAMVNDRRAAKGKSPMTAQEEADMLARRAADRSGGSS